MSEVMEIKYALHRLNCQRTFLKQNFCNENFTLTTSHQERQSNTVKWKRNICFKPFGNVSRNVEAKVRRILLDKNNFQSISMSKKLKRTLKEENEEWELQYFLVNSGGKMSCLLCDTAIVTVKKFNAQQHYVLHKGKKIYQIRG
uniref:SPIN-DOC-like zinc-finger domain-containing protein n=1 Tax=Octopus bimaculoides TaxID=37653 RepID=A0A0L8HWU5_OCTBM